MLRRALLTIAALNAAASFAAAGQMPALNMMQMNGGPQMTWRGLAQGPDLAEGYYNGGGAMSESFRMPMYSNVPIRYCKVAIPLYYPNGASLTDTMFAGNQAILSYQFGVEYPFSSALSGLAKRIPVTFSGANSWTYRSAGWSGGWYKLSDTFDFGQWLPAKTKFGVWSTVEIPTNIGTGALPTVGNNGSNCLQRYIGAATNTTSQIKALGGASDFALTSTSIPAATSDIAGQAVYVPMLLCEEPIDAKLAVTIGDSIAAGVGEGGANGGQTCAATNGDSYGDALGNGGIVQRGVYEDTNGNGVNLGLASDGAKNLHTASNWLGRQALLALANPTTVFQIDVHNDVIPAPSVGSWVKNTAYAPFTVKYNNGAIYIATTGGTTKNQTGAGPTGAGAGIVDGTVVWNYLAPYLGDGTDSVGSLVGWEAQTNAIIKSIAPNAAILAMTATPYSTSTDSWKTVANQTAGFGAGSSTSVARWNAFVTSRNPALLISGYIDPDAALETSYPATQSGVWVVAPGQNVVDYATQNDGVHPNSVGYGLVQAAGVINQSTIH
jgi:lysophospholipase L1-like esterase